MAFAIAWEPQGATVRYLGRITFQEFMEAVLTIHAHPDYASIQFVIHDMLGATELSFDDLDMTAIVAHELGARYTNPTVRPAVVSLDPTMAEKTRLFSALTQLDVGLYSSMQEARAHVTARRP